MPGSIPTQGSYGVTCGFGTLKPSWISSAVSESSLQAIWLDMSRAAKASCRRLSKETTLLSSLLGAQEWLSALERHL